MTRIQKILLPFALLLGACDPADAEVAEADLAADDAVVTRNSDDHGKRGGKLARLDADKDGAISLAEATGTRLADKFSELDSDADGKLTRDEMKAMKRMQGDKGRHGRHGGDKLRKDPAARAAKMLEKRDADHNGSLSAAELAGSRLADKFAALDTDKDGALARDELMAMKGHGPRGERKDPAARAAKLLEKRDADHNGSLSAAEVAGSRFADKFTAVDTDNNGAVTRDELVAFKPNHPRRDAK